ncbi:MAG: glycosyltransferase, partial [Proteobacteria bacterium]|nr:glycosyltransferase [Pseudomonadota bacterium]
MSVNLSACKLGYLYQTMTPLQHTSVKVSIVIPTFNEEKFLPLCLESISNLVWPGNGLEVIVVDNGS